MTFYGDLYDNGCCSLFVCDDLCGIGGLNGYQFGSPYGYYCNRYRYGSPYGYRSLYGNRGLAGYGGYYGCGDLYGCGYGYPFFSRFGNRYNFC